MAVPTFTSYTGASSTTQTIPLPATRAGRRVFIFLPAAFSGSFNGNGSTWIALLAIGALGGVYYRDCTGSEANPTVTLSTAAQYRAITATLAAGDYLSGVAPVISTAPGTVLDPNGVSTGGGNGTVFAWAHWAHTTTCNLTANPAGYSAGQSAGATSVIPGNSLSYKQPTPAAATEDPGVFTLSVAPTSAQSYTIWQKSTFVLSPPLHTNTQQFGGDDGVTNFTPPALASSAFTFGQSPIAATSHDIPLPTDLNGKRLIVAFTGLGTATSSIVFPAGWTEIDTTSNANERQEIFYRDCDGSEGSLLTITTATSILASWGMVEFPKGSFDKAQAPVGSATTSTSTLTPNPGSVNSGAGLGFSRGAYWLSSLGQRGVASPPTITAAPAGFTLRGSSVGANVYGTAWADKVDNVQTLDPGTWTTTGTATNQSASTIAVKAAWPVAKLVFTAPLTILVPPRFDNAQEFYGPKLKAAYAAPFYPNPQAFYAPKLRVTLKVAALHQNQQAFYAPSILAAAPPNILTPPRFNNAQAFYGVTLTFNLRLSVPFHTNAQTFYGPTLFRLQKLVAPLHQNAQEFYAPGILRSSVIATPFHQNQQAFYGPTIITPRIITLARYDNVPTIYAPTLRFGLVVRAPLHTNAQQFYGPKLRMTVKLARYDNAQQFFSPSLIFHYYYAAPFYQNTQVFYGPSLRFDRRLQPPLHDNAQQFFGPRLRFIVKLSAFHQNTQEFYGPSIVKATAGKLFPPRHQNTQVFYGPSLTFRDQVKPTFALGAAGGFQREAKYRPRDLEDEEVEWLLPTSIQIKNEAPPWNPVVVQPELARSRAKAEVRFRREMEAIDAKRRRIRKADEVLINVITTILKDQT